MNLKAIITSALLIVGTSSAAFAAPVVVEHGRPLGHGPVVARPIVERGWGERGWGYGHGPVVIEHAPVRPIWHPVWRPIVRPLYTAVGFTTIGTYGFAFDGSQDIDLGAGRAVDTLRVAGDTNTEIFSLVVTYADGQQQTIPCDQVGSFETNLGGNVVTNVQVNARRTANAAPLEIQIA